MERGFFIPLCLLLGIPGKGTAERTRGAEQRSGLAARNSGADQGRRWARPVRTAIAKSIAKAAPRPNGPVTSQARALASGDMLPSPARRSAPRDDPFFQARAVPGGDGALGAALVKGEAALLGQLE